MKNDLFGNITINKSTPDEESASYDGNDEYNPTDNELSSVQEKTFVDEMKDIMPTPITQNMSVEEKAIFEANKKVRISDFIRELKNDYNNDSYDDFNDSYDDFNDLAI